MADQYDDIEARIQTLIQGLTRFTGVTERVTRGNFNILTTGIPEAVVLESGSVSVETQEGFGVYRTYDVLVTLFTRYGGDEAQAHADFRSLRGDILTVEEQYPRLNNLSGVIQTEMQSDGDPQDLFDKQGGGPYFRTQTMRWSVTRRYSVSGGEY